MDDRTDGWMEKASQPQRPLLYVMSFAISLGLKARVFACSFAASITQADSAQFQSRKCMGKYASVVGGYLISRVKY
jgi:hypothetical protein